MKMKRVFFTITAFLMATLITCNALAANGKPSSSQEELSFAKSSHGDTRLTDFTAHENGSISYFIVETPSGGPVTPAQFQSQDYGQTWRQMNMDWFSQIEKMYPGFGIAQDFHIADNGDIYCIASIGQKTQKVNMDGRDVTCYPTTYGVFKYAGGKVEQIPNIIMGNYYQPYRTIEDVLDNGDIVIQRINSPDATQEATGVSIYSANGQLKKDFPMDMTGWLPTVCSNHAIYGVYFEDSQPSGIVKYDLLTGKKSVPAVFSQQQTTKFPYAIGVSEDGTIYAALSSGLYKCLPGSDSFTKLIGGDHYKLAKNTGCSRKMACSNDGTVYLQIWFQNEAKYDDPNNGKQGRLYRYRPA